MKKRLVIGNWKMYLEKPEQATLLSSGLRRRTAAFKGVEVALAAPYVLIPTVAASLKGSVIRTAAQGLSAHEDGAHTGEVSGAMLKAAQVSLVIVGHSERRALGESDSVIRSQVLEAHKAGLFVVLCVGEAERDPSGAHFSFIEQQLLSALEGMQAPSTLKFAIAYEPIWAIGKSAAEAMAPADLQGVSIFIRKVLTDRFGRAPAARVPILYGGSVDGSNAQKLIKEGSINGFLVGRASTDLEAFLEILKVCKA